MPNSEIQGGHRSYQETSCEATISWNLRSLLHMRFLFKRLYMNTIIFLIQSSGNPFPERKIINNSLHFWSNILWQYIIKSTTLRRNLIPNAFTLGTITTMIKGYLLIQMRFFTSVLKRAISNGIVNIIEMVLIGDHTTIQRETFLYGSPRILLFEMRIFRWCTPWDAIRKGTHGAFTATTVMMNGYFTGNISTRSVNENKSIRRLLVLMIMWPIQKYTSPTSHQTVINMCRNKKETRMRMVNMI